MLRMSSRDKGDRLLWGPRRDDDGWRQWEIVASGDILKELLTGFALDWNQGMKAREHSSMPSLA